MSGIYPAERWPLPAGHFNGPLPADQVAICIRQYEADPAACTNMDGLPLPTLKSWLEFCQWCFDEFGAYPDGT